MVLNPGKCHYIVIGDDDPTSKIILNNTEIASSNEEKLLDIFLLDSKLNFNSHVTSFCKKAGQKLSALARINHYLTQDKKLFKLSSKIPIQLLPTDPDVYFSILKQRIKQHSRKSLTFDLQYYELPFDRILEDNKQKNIHQKNIESSAIETYKFQAGLTPPIMSDLFVTKDNNYNLRNFQELKSLHKRTVDLGTETISYRGPQKWNLIPEGLEPGHWKH